MEMRGRRALSAGEAAGLACCKVEQLWLYLGSEAVLGLPGSLKGILKLPEA